MEFSDQVWTHRSVLLSGNAGDLWLMSIPSADPVTFTVRVSDSSSGSVDEFPFSLSPDSYGRIRLDMRKILKGLDPLVRAGLDNISSVTGSGSLLLKTVTLTASQGEETVTAGWPVVSGETPSESEADSLLAPEYFWNRKPQESVTYVSAIETVSLLPASALTIGGLRVRVFFRMQPPQIVTLWASWDVSAVSDIPVLLMFDCSYALVRKAADAAGWEGEDILAYDVFWVDRDGNAGRHVQRFVVRSARSRTFLFRNSLGTYDSIHAVADGKRTQESEVTVFESGGEEKELLNDHHVAHEDGSGYIGSEEEANFWYEFLSSDERYVRVGSEWRRIIVEESESEARDFAVMSFAFTWHFSEEPAGAVQTRRELDEIYIPREI